ncbi:E3 ubiquitin-protein ligase RNF128-like [Nerophis ophidion]|uniref:E3 ubiquitin-protein ligase RNF128-like n=1 Tax=Nerophis ophidion TaxID=159077 RepID=UPI002ADFA70C|nr:E3 ubiquitin-protein ligase RNF128-like [Nerophis ophidion]
MGEKTHRSLLLLLCLSGLLHCSAALVFWTAVVEINYFISPNQTVDRDCECGVFGRNSPLAQATGMVVLPKGDPKGCQPDSMYNFSALPWIALVKRGNCTFSEKINAAKRYGASAVVVYNVDGTGNSTTHMAHSDALDVVSIMIGNIQGMEIASLVKNGTQVRMLIDAGSPHGPWMDTYWLYFMSIAFFIVTAASVAYFLFISANRLHNLRTHRRAERKLKSEAKKAIGHLQVRTLKRDDKETIGDHYMCAVCIESYKASEVVTVLTCDHIFHKACIEPWLLEKRTCPMCKCDILKALGVDVEEKESMAEASPQEVTVITVAGGEAMYEVPLTGPLSSDPERHQRHYDNRAFEEEPAARAQ